MIFTYIFARSPNYGLTNRAFGGNIYRQSTRLWKTNMGVFPSGQWGQTVNLLLNASVVRIHQLPPKNTGTHVPVFFLFPEDFSVCWDTAALAADPAPKDKRIKIRQSLLTNAVS